MEPGDEVGDGTAEAEWTRIVDWAEESGLENLRARHATYLQIKDQAQVTFTTIAAGIGGAFAIAAKVVAPGSAGPVAFGAALLCVYLALVAATLVVKCMLFRPIPSITNEPLNLLKEGFGLAQIKQSELAGVQSRIDEMTAINSVTANWLNRTRLLALLSPLMFGLGAAIYEPSIHHETARPLNLECRASVGGDGASALACKQVP